MTEPLFRVAAQEYNPETPIGELTEHPENPNQGDIGAISDSIEAHGFYGTVVVQRSTGYILAGNHRYRAAAMQGARTLPALWLDCDDDEARRILLADNRTTHLATFDEAKLLALLTTAGGSPAGLRGTGYTMDAYDDLAALLRGPAITPAEDGETSMNDDGYDNTHGQGGPDSRRYEERGLRDIILVLPTADADRLAAAVVTLRQRWGDLTQAGILLRAAETCTRMAE